MIKGQDTDELFILQVIFEYAMKKINLTIWKGGLTGMKAIKHLVFFAVISLFLFFSMGSALHAQPTGPPPAGQIWINGPNGWGLVVAPPDNSPYVWVVDHWEKITVIPPGKVWVSPHWGKDGWVPGHWRAIVYPYKGAAWIPGYWGPKGGWVVGRWRGGRPRVHPRVYPHTHPVHRGRTWVPGHHTPRGRWVPGHWR